jgi:hypothetical protein
VLRAQRRQGRIALGKQASKQASESTNTSQACRRKRLLLPQRGLRNGKRPGGKREKRARVRGSLDAAAAALGGSWHAGGSQATRSCARAPKARSLAPRGRVAGKACATSRSFEEEAPRSHRGRTILGGGDNGRCGEGRPRSGGHCEKIVRARFRQRPHCRSFPSRRVLEPPSPGRIIIMIATAPLAIRRRPTFFPPANPAPHQRRTAQSEIVHSCTYSSSKHRFFTSGGVEKETEKAVSNAATEQARAMRILRLVDGDLLVALATGASGDVSRLGTRHDSTCRPMQAQLETLSGSASPGAMTWPARCRITVTVLSGR